MVRVDSKAVIFDQLRESAKESAKVMSELRPSYSPSSVGLQVINQDPASREETLEVRPALKDAPEVQSKHKSHHAPKVISSKILELKKVEGATLPQTQSFLQK